MYMISVFMTGKRRKDDNKTKNSDKNVNGKAETKIMLSTCVLVELNNRKKYISEFLKSFKNVFSIAFCSCPQY